MTWPVPRVLLSEAMDLNDDGPAFATGSDERQPLASKSVVTRLLGMRGGQESPQTDAHA